jgi:hypothetical protein
MSPPNANIGIVILVLAHSIFCSASTGKALKYSNAERAVPGDEK